MLKRLRSVAAVLFVGVFVFALAFTLAANSAYANPPYEPYACCEVWDGDVLYLKGVWYIGQFPNPGNCRCAPMHNFNNCELLCPHIE